MPEPVRSGIVDWTGDNPFIYLKSDPDGDWSSLSLFFRISASPHGRGSATLVVEDPYGEPGGTARRVLLTDNPGLAKYLVDGFVRRFALFRRSRVLDHLTVVDGATFDTTVTLDAHLERAVAADGRTVVLAWYGLGTPFAVDLPPEQSGTGEHEMFSVFRTADAAAVHVDGVQLPGHTVEREFQQRRAQSAALAISETWVGSVS